MKNKTKLKFLFLKKKSKNKRKKEIQGKDKRIKTLERSKEIKIEN